MLVHLTLNSLFPLRLGLVPGYHELTRFRHHGYPHKELVCLLAIFKRLLAIFKQLRARVRACVSLVMLNPRACQFLVQFEYKTIPQPEPQTRPLAVWMVVLVCIPGSGKSFVADLFHKRGWVIVNQDALGDRRKCEHAAYLALNGGRSVLIDRTNFDEDQRKHWLRIAEKCRVPAAATAAVFLKVDIDTCKERVMSRKGHPTLKAEKSSDHFQFADEPVHDMAVVDWFVGKLKIPVESEGFGRIVVLQQGELESPYINDIIAMRLS